MVRPSKYRCTPDPLIDVGSRDANLKSQLVKFSTKGFKFAQAKRKQGNLDVRVDFINFYL